MKDNREIDCKVEMTASVNPSEDPEKIKTAVSNIFPYSVIATDKFSVTAKSEEIGSLEKIYEAIHSRQSHKAYRRSLEKNLQDCSTWFYLNRQAAFAKKIAICEKADESPLGPIKVTVVSSRIDEIIDLMVSKSNLAKKFDPS